MSHIARQETKAGQPVFKDLACLREAAAMLGLRVLEQATYAGFSRERGSDAVLVLQVDEPQRAELTRKHHRPPHEIGIVPDKNNPGCYAPAYDPYGGGYGLNDIVGQPIVGRNYQVSLLAPKLKQHYDMCCDAAAAREAADSFEMLTRKQAGEKYPQYFEQSDDEDTFVSITDSRARLGV